MDKTAIHRRQAGLAKTPHRQRACLSLALSLLMIWGPAIPAVAGMGAMHGMSEMGNMSNMAGMDSATGKAKLHSASAHTSEPASAIDSCQRECDCCAAFCSAYIPIQQEPDVFTPAIFYSPRHTVELYAGTASPLFRPPIIR